jgi:FYVE zinc finger
LTILKAPRMKSTLSRCRQIWSGEATKELELLSAPNPRGLTLWAPGWLVWWLEQQKASKIYSTRLLERLYFRALVNHYCTLDLDESESTTEAADESEIDEIFSTRALSLITTTPASSLHEDLDEPQYGFTFNVDEDHHAVHFTQTTHGDRYNQSSGSSNYPRRIAIGDPAINPTASARHPRSDNRPGGGHGNEGNRNPRGHSATWEPDETVLSCRLCSRRFSTFLRRHHCRYKRFTTI